MSEEVKLSTANQVARPILFILIAAFLIHWLTLIGLRLDPWLEAKGLPRVPEAANDFVTITFWVRVFLSTLLAFVAWKAYPTKVAPQPTTQHLWRLDLFRLTLAGFFFLYAFIVAKSMIPLPDEPPRINSQGVTCVVLGLVIAYYSLTSRYRMFLYATWIFYLWAAVPQLEKKIKFMEMMLEPRGTLLATYHAFGLIILILLLPRTLRMFSRPASSYQATPSPIFKKGFPF